MVIIPRNDSLVSPMGFISVLHMLYIMMIADIVIAACKKRSLRECFSVAACALSSSSIDCHNSSGSLLVLFEIL